MYAAYNSTFKKRDADLRIKPGRRAWSEQRLLPLLAPMGREARILELGCGDGEFLQLLESWGYKNGLGVDVSPEQIAIAERRGVRAKLENVESVLTRSEMWDVIVALDVLEHFAAPEAMQILEACFQRLSVGGRIVIQTPNGGGVLAGHVIFGDVTHAHIYAPSSLNHILSLAGFSVVGVKEAGPVAVGVRGWLRTKVWYLLSGAATVIYRVQTGKSQSVWTETMIAVAEKINHSRPNRQ